MTTTSPRARSLWWVSPAGALLLLVPGTLLLTFYLDDADFRLFYRATKSVPGDHLLLLAAAVALLGAVATFVARVPRRRPGNALLPGGLAVPRTLRRSAEVLFWLTMAGYVAFAATGASRGVTLSQVLQLLVSQNAYEGNLKDEFAGVAGITTLTQCGIAFVVVATYVLLRVRDRRLLLQLGVVLLLSLVRSFVNSERLALIEVAVPLVAVVAMAARHSAVPARRLAARAAPVVLAPLLLALFALFEYSRSWTFFSTRTDQPFPVFAAVRLAGYYATSYNNGYLQLEHATYPGRLPRESVSFFWEAPFVSQLGLYDLLGTPPPTTSQDVLERYANPEFNNLGGITAPMVDFGVIGGLVYLALLGAVIGLLYRGFREGTVLGALLYPVALTGLLELPRYLYLAQGRVVPAVLSLAVVGVLLLRERRTDPPRPRPSEPRPTVAAGAPS
ncbi:hypothetical protein GCM10028777_06790 [Angustibacter speluncae]